MSRLELSLGVPTEDPLYDHTQKCHRLYYAAMALVLLIFAGAVLLSLQAQTTQSVTQTLLVTLLFIVTGVLMVSMNALRVRVFPGYIKLNYQLGLPRKTIWLDQVQGVHPVRNHPMMGWGIRYIGRGWLYNISGLDAVELELTRGRLLRIGTNDPERLARVIEREIRASGR